MNAEESHPDEDSILTRLLACDKALAEGTPPQQPIGAETPVELQPRLQGDLACIQILRQVLPRHPTGATPVPAGELPFQQLGRFQIRRLLGQGAFGMVLLASDPQLGRAVALKVPRPEALLTGELRERFVREARAAAGLDHPNLVPVYEAGTVGSLCYIASAYCPGVTLAEWLKERSELAPERLAATLVATLADAVGHAHARGVIHRDLKPSNVLLQGPGRDAADPHATVQDASGVRSSAAAEEELVPRITDFGLAKLTADAPAPPGEAVGAETRSGAVLGTPNYMAPEQAQGKNKEVGPAADVYALGAILYELLTGRPPFRGESLLDTLEQVRSRDPLPLRRLRPKLARDLETICLKCLQKEPHKRYASASALADDLRRYLAGESIRARSIGAWERGLKWARRRPAQAMLAAAALTLAVVVVSYSAVLAESNAQLKDRNNQLEEIKAALENSNTQLQKTNEELKRQRDEAREVAVQAEQFMDDMFTAFQQDWTKGNIFTIARIGGPSELRVNPQQRQFLQKQLDFCKNFLQRHGDNPSLRRDAGRAHSICGEIYYLLERYADSEKILLKALELQQKLADQFPDQLQYKNDLLWSYHDLYFTYMDKADMKRVEAVLKKTVTVREKLIRDHPTEFAYYHDQANSYYELGDCYRKSGKEKECLEAHRQRARMWEKACRDHPANTAFAVQLAQSYDWIGGWMNEHDQPKEGLEWRNRAIRTLEALLKKEPRNFPARITLRNTHSGRAWTFERLGRYQQARADWERAIELDGHVETVGVAKDAYRMNSARILARTGDHVKAAAEAQTLTGQSWANEFRLREAVNVLALSNSAVQRDAKLPEAERSKLAERYASHAVDCLKRARDAGYFGYDSAARIESLRKDKDLDVLRKREDFQALMLSFQPKNQKKKSP